MAAAGIASRRKSEELIAAGRVRVNGKIVTEQGLKVDSYKDKVEVDGRRLVREKPVYFVVHKPREMVSTLDDPRGRACLGDLFEKVDSRVFPVGRLDYHTSGVILATNDGELTDGLLRPKNEVPKTYLAKMSGNIKIEALDLLRNGVRLDDGYKTRKAEVFVERVDGNNSWVNITLREGKNRQVHRMGDAVGHRVMRLVRLSFAGLTAEGLRPGELRPLSPKELDKLKKSYL